MPSKLPTINFHTKKEIIEKMKFMWWGGRKAVRTLMSAFRKGKVSM